MVLIRAAATPLFLLSMPTTILAFAPNLSSSRTMTLNGQQMVKQLHDAEAGKGASWAGARFGDEFLSTGHWSTSETHGRSSSNAMDGPSSSGAGGGHHYTRSETSPRSKSAHTSTWVSGAHAESGNSYGEWSGARRGDYGVIAKRAGPTHSPWLE